MGDGDVVLDDGEVAYQDPCQKNKESLYPEAKVNIIKFGTFMSLNIKVPNVQTESMVYPEVNNAQCHICKASFHPSELRVRCYCGIIFCFNCHCVICRGGVVVD